MKNKRQHNSKKIAAGAAILIFAIALLLAGTFAWYSYTNAINIFDGKDPYDVVLHDDYDNVPDDQGKYQKEVYAENTGTQEVYVRIRLDEYMEIEGVSLMNGAERDQTVSGNTQYWNTWHRHLPNTDGSHQHEPEYCEQDFHTYWEWTMGDDGSFQYIPAKDPHIGHIPSGGTSTIYRYDPANNDTWLGYTGSMKQAGTGSATEVITMAEYQSRISQGQTFVGWAYDTDGYAYWTELLQPGEATGLLLQSVQLLKVPGESYYYGINVYMEAVSHNDLTAWTLGTESSGGELTERATADAREMLWKISGTTPDTQVHNDIAAAIETNYGAVTAGSLADSSGEYPEVTIDGEEWVVLSYDPETREAELMSKKISTDIGYLQYHANEAYPTWEKSAIRARIELYYRTDLNESIRGLTVRSEIMSETAYNNPTPIITEDWVYLLSGAEMNQYYPQPRDSYPLQRIADYSDNIFGSYWLRNPSENVDGKAASHSKSAETMLVKDANASSIVSQGRKNGEVTGYNVTTKNTGGWSPGARPALKVALSGVIVN